MDTRFSITVQERHDMAMQERGHQGDGRTGIVAT
jgi:hypothetical protein